MERFDQQAELTDSAVLVAANGTFYRCPSGSREVIPTDLDGARRLAAPTTSFRPSGTNDTDRRPVDRVAAGAPLVALANPGSLRAFDETGRSWLDLGAAHLEVWVEAHRRGTRAHVLASTGLDPAVVDAALRDLIDLGALSVVHTHQVDDPPPHSSVTPKEGGTLARWLRRRQHRRSGDAHGATVVHPKVSSAGDAAPPAPEVTPSSGRAGRGGVPVVGFWSTQDGPPVGSASVIAYARVHDGGQLNRTYEFFPILPPDEALQTVSGHDGPAVLLCGNYVWSLDANLELARRAVEDNPEIVVIHGGPSTPRQPKACEAFLRDLPGRHVAVAGEGEITFTEILERLAPTSGGRLDVGALEGVPGCRTIDPSSGRYLHGPDRERHATLEDFPSPFVSGEFDRVPDDEIHMVAMETNRGCPFSCTFCDWGSATMSRIRTFPMDRVRAEFDWMARRGIRTWYLADANFGMLPRDLEIARAIADHRRTTGLPDVVVAFPAKNASDRYLEVVDTLTSAGIVLRAALALQTRDDHTLEAVRRSNIRTESYDHLVAESRRRRLPIVTELMVGLPGATVDSLKDDMQWCIDQGVRAWLYDTVALPNAPMSEPQYIEQHAIRSAGGRVVATSSYSESDRAHMDRIVDGYQCFEILGSIRHVLRFVQWDHGIRAVDVIDELTTASATEPHRYPLVGFHLRHSRRFLVPPVGWTPFLDEVRQLVVERLGVPDDAALSTALTASRQSLPWPGRTYPDVAELDHDYVHYFTTRMRPTEGSDPSTSLGELGGGRLVVSGDPLDVVGSIAEHTEMDPFLQAFDFELESPLALYRSVHSDRGTVAVHDPAPRH